MEDQRRLRHKLSRERRGAARELKKDSQYIAQRKEEQARKSAAEEKEKVKRFMSLLESQQAEKKQVDRWKSRDKKRKRKDKK